jgi:hypothetical protein
MSGLGEARVDLPGIDPGSELVDHTSAAIRSITLGGTYRQLFYVADVQAEDQRLTRNFTLIWMRRTFLASSLWLETGELDLSER